MDDNTLDSWPAQAALAIGTGVITSRVATHRWSRPSRWLVHAGTGAVTGAATALSLSRMDGSPGPDGAPAVRPGTATTVATSIAVGTLVGVVSRGAESADAWTERTLAARGVRRPRMWMGVAAAGASLAISVVDRRRAARGPADEQQSQTSPGPGGGVPGAGG
ncbi:hypothetical protein [Nocardioides hwasunensis]|uniref:Uncharacterized protein n=1 Tax=Nocardioides hwasunensis TaxID=397258 RepID=A0ABR8MEB8_9ACTN|nr:hypothetical protein [Nocardioides hwasunensis]MBD3914454.1 hypothetical protein [Nocardioides hwasunensis]